MDNRAEQEHSEDVLSRDSVRDDIFEIASGIFAIDVESKDDFESFDIMEDMRCDTLDLVEFAMSVEEEFGIILTEDVVDSLTTFGEYVDTVWDLVKERVDHDEIGA